ncbi:hypothetical protein EFN57_10395 [Leuconostoc citreum]|uniref:hypothetical protein n=1 Tax=Leuconostoc citreum TaxID=33964 RepID=UPI0021A316BB|nr:hypothetical protein [Leuconostoc citreum]MCT3054460.1 hypothetical protein [Leuconostoc citreum]MCT3063328.1 hypothetical protein [Leuconostoc citreum]
MTEPVAYMWKTERGTIIGFTPNDNSHSGGRLGIPLYTADQLHSMKWFVRSKEPEDEDEYYLFLSGSDLDDLEYFGFDYARAFDTKEEAELWTNPLTEAVQLPVEGE